MNLGTPGLPVHYHLLEFTQTHVHRVGDAVPFSSCPPSLPASESFPMSQLFTWGGQITGVSASGSFPLKNTQGWSPSEWTGWISLQSKGLSRVCLTLFPLFPHLFLMKWWDQMPWSSFSECWALSRLSHSPLSLSLFALYICGSASVGSANCGLCSTIFIGKNKGDGMFETLSTMPRYCKISVSICF